MPPNVPGHVVPCGACVGLDVVVLVAPRPPPSFPTITMEVGTLLAPPRNDKLFFSWIVRLVPVATYGTVIRTGDQFVPAFGFNAEHVAVLAGSAVPQLYPH